jgi:hypothetical protein
LRLVPSSIPTAAECNIRENSAAVLHDVHAATTFKEVGLVMQELVVGRIDRASSGFDDTLSRQPSIFLAPSNNRIFLTIPLCVWGIQPENDKAGV